MFSRPADFTGEPRLKDEVEIQRQFEVKQREIKEYNLFREAVLDDREQDRKRRNLAKERQLQKCIELQVRAKLSHSLCLAYAVKVRRHSHAVITCPLSW